MKDDTNDAARYRLDKWLWAARLYRNRTLAQDAIDGGKVQYNGQRTKPGKAVELHARITVRRERDAMEIIVTGLSNKRGNATMAQTLYTETPESVKEREEQAWRRRIDMTAQMPPARRPNKKQRRQIHRFLDTDQE